MKTCSWPLGNGESLEFTIYTTNGNWNKVAGIYIFAYLDGQYWNPLYIGETEDFSTRFPHHEHLDEAVRRGATAIHALVVPQVANRLKWEKMLIEHLQPPMNVEYR